MSVRMAWVSFFTSIGVCIQVFLGLKNRTVQAINSTNGAVMHEHTGFDADFVGLDLVGECVTELCWR